MWPGEKLSAHDACAGRHFEGFQGSFLLGAYTYAEGFEVALKIRAGRVGLYNLKMKMNVELS